MIDDVDKAILFALCFVHWLIIAYFLLYYYISRALVLSKTEVQTLDFIYLAFAAFIMVHWVICKWECIISYIEKKLLNPSYQLGSDPFDNPSLFLGMNVTMGHPIIQLVVFGIWALISINIAFILIDMFPMHRVLVTGLVGSSFIVFIMMVISLYNYKLNET
jgi:hypothetical protein